LTFARTFRKSWSEQAVRIGGRAVAITTGSNLLVGKPQGMRFFLYLTLSVCLLTLPVLADREQLSGSWLSSSGAFVVVGPTDSNDGFVMNVYKSAHTNELSNQVRATWFDGPNFVYQVNGEQITGVYWEDKDIVEVQNRSGSWKSSWRRN